MSILKKIKDTIQGKAPAGAKRSSKWPKVRKEHLEKHPECAVCGGLKKIEVHHMVPYHIDPSKELDPTNLITLCEDWSYGINCHLLIGHTGSYRRANLDVEKDAKFWYDKLKKAKQGNSDGEKQ